MQNANSVISIVPVWREKSKQKNCNNPRGCDLWKSRMAKRVQGLFAFNQVGTIANLPPIHRGHNGTHQHAYKHPLKHPHAQTHTQKGQAIIIILCLRFELSSLLTTSRGLSGHSYVCGWVLM